MKRFANDARQIVHIGDQIMMLGDGPTDFDNGRLLKRVRADHVCLDLSGDGDDGNAVQFGVGQGGHQVGGAGSAGRHADADFTGGACVALRCKAAALFVPWQDGPQFVAPAA